MLRIHLLQQWFGLSEPAMEEALHDVPLYREFAGLDVGAIRMPDESAILRFRHLLETNSLSMQLLAKHTAQRITLFALSNLWMARRRIIQGAQG